MNKRKLESTTRTLFKGRPLDLSQRMSFSTIAGLSLLYASAYFLPLVSGFGAYLLPSLELVHLIILPTAVAVLTVTVLAIALSSGAQKWASPRVATLGAIVALSLLVLVAVKVLFYAAGYDWRKLIPIAEEKPQILRYVKYLAFCAAIAGISAKTGLIPTICRFLSSLGYALAGLGVLNMVMICRGEPAATANMGTSSYGPLPMLEGQNHRRVVWVIFDETDFERTFSTARFPGLRLPNFERLSKESIFATNAISPASATLYSIPALLTGVPLTGDGIRIDRKGTLLEKAANDTSIPFDENTSIFGRIAAAGQTASILGFYHPYCRLFASQFCHSAEIPAIGSLTDGLWANLPEKNSSPNIYSNQWQVITRESLRLLPQFLQRHDALTFMHLNIPHLPAAYADNVLRVAASPDPIAEYAHNLALTDRVIGQITQEVERQAKSQEILLVVSTDHWLRNRWYRPNDADVTKPVVFIVWKVGETQGISLPAPLSTVHTAEMILDFLSGKLRTQAEIAQWWQQQTVFPAFIAPSY